MKNSKIRLLILAVLIGLPLLSSAWIPATAVERVALTEARFVGLTRIVVTADKPLTGITADRLVITKPDGAVIPPEQIAGVEPSPGGFTVSLTSAPFARITSEGTAIATRAFGAFASSKPVKIGRTGEPASNGHIIGSGSSIDEGWNTIRTDLEFVDPVTGEKGLYKQADVTPNRDESGRPVAWNDGRINAPVHRSETMLMLLVEFPDRRAADAEDPYKETKPYLDYLQGCTEWFARASYGQFRFSVASPQVAKSLGWIMMDKNAVDYRAGANTIPAYAYIAEAARKAYDKWGIKVDDFEHLVIMPAKGKSGLSNGPSYTHRKPVGPKEPNLNRVVYVDKDKKPHYIDTAITAGNDLFRWGYRWAVHELGHNFGLPDLYSYAAVIKDIKVGIFFFCGGWDMMGNIAGHSTDFLSWPKWKLRWVRDDQVDVVTRPTSGPTSHKLSPVETPGGTKMVVIRTGLSTAYVAEFRTRLGVNALDERAKYSGVVIYRIDAARSGARNADYTGQVISKKFYNDPAVGGPKNLTGLWRPIDNRLDGYDSQDCCWQPGDSFSDPATGVKIGVSGITRCDPANPSASAYTADDVATVTVEKSMGAELFQPVVLSNARLKGLTVLTFDTNIEMQMRPANQTAAADEPRYYVREDSILFPKSLVITRSDGSIVPPDKILKITVSPTSVEVSLAKDAFARPRLAAKATVATKSYYWYGPGAAIPISVAD